MEDNYNVHTHCNSCFYTKCSETDCPLIKCSHCFIPLHSCKLQEHSELVCRRAQVPCPNATNGCKQLIVREKIPNHLPKCIASVVVCSRDRCRKLNIRACKLPLKHMGRKNQLLPVEHPDLDVSLALYDQNMIIQSYNSSRAKRVKQRDPIHPTHPLIPLRNMPFDNSGPTEGLEDSSGDELREKREKLKKSRMVFANCYMCQIDPSVQHLHTLGNGMDIEKLKKRRRTSQVLDAFHDKLNLKVSIAVENAPESVLKSENIREIKKGGTFYTLKCLKTVKRLEYGDHCLSQHTLSVDQMNEMIVRCPNWTKGCEFSASRIKFASGGELRFHTHSATLTHSLNSADYKLENSSPYTLENLPLWAYETLARYLPSSSLYNLSLTSKKLRKVVFIGCYSQCYVEPVWRKVETNGEWFPDGNIIKISSTEPPPKLTWKDPVELSEHLQKCAFFEPVTYDQEMVPVFPKNLELEIWKGFAEELSQRMIRMELMEEQE
uniref:F-box domain-containing protein n=1 Tax=Caenorhabditis japonica TaxID=281687 RepID=A0A8R1I1W5_CAEJA